MKPDLYAKIIEIAPSSEEATLTAAVREAISLALNQDVIDIAIAMALKAASLDRIPAKGVQLYDFIMGPLRSTIHSFASVEESDLAITRLVGILAPQLAKIDGVSTEVSAVRRISKVVPPATELTNTTEQDAAPFPDDEPTRNRSMENIVLDPSVRQTSRPPPPFPESHSLLVFTADPDVSFLFGVLLGSAPHIETHFDVGRFVEELESNQHTNTVIVIDVRESNQPATVLARITPSLPTNSPVVFWGADETLKTHFSSLIDDFPGKWITCSLAVELEDLVALIRCAV